MFTNRPKETAGPSGVAGFATNEAHLASEIGWVAELLRLAVLEVQSGPRRDDRFDEFSGLYVAERDIIRFLDSEEGNAIAPTAPQSDEMALRVEEQRRRVARERGRIDALVADAQAQRIDLRLPRLIERFALGDAERTALLCCLAPDLDENLQKCFAYLQNDVSRKRPSFGLLTSLCRAGEELFATWHLFGPDATLFEHRLLALPAAAANDSKPFQGLEPRVPHAIIRYLAGDHRADGLLGGSATVISPRPLEVTADYYRHHRSTAERMLAARRGAGNLPLSYVWGPAGCDKSLAIEAVAHGLGRKVLHLDLNRLSSERLASSDVRCVLRRDARLHDCLLHLIDPGRWLEETKGAQDRAASLKAFLQGVRDLDVLLSGDHNPSRLRSELELSFSDHEIPLPSIDERSQLWLRQLSGLALDRKQDVAGALAGKFRFGPAQIRSALRATGVGDGNLSPPIQSLALPDLYRSCRNESNQGLDHYAHRVRPRFRWRDIVLPDDTRRQLKEICSCVNLRQSVFGGWGFDRKFSLGKGLNVLFCGSSGTGKTMSAEIIAGELELDLFKIDLSSVVSKYVGETERNLSRIFGEAESSNSILFFDEADALFGKRSEVKDAHDRYANIEINYLLQKLDDYEGIIILATNLKNNLDAAFTRRLNYTVEFPFPDEQYRHLIWRQVFPEEAPVAEDVDFAFLAERFRMAGGNIKNIALNSAFMAATKEDEIRMEHIILAIKREYQKLGKLCTKSEYGPYFNMIRDTGTT